MSSTYDGRDKTTTVLAWLVSVTLCIFSGRSCLHLCTMHAACEHAGYIWMRIMCTYVAVSEVTPAAACCYMSSRARQTRACSCTKCSAITISKQWITRCYVLPPRLFSVSIDSWHVSFWHEPRSMCLLLDRKYTFIFLDSISLCPFRCCRPKKYECYRFAPYFERLCPITATRNDHFARPTRSTVNGIGKYDPRGELKKAGEKNSLRAQSQTLRLRFRAIRARACMACSRTSGGGMIDQAAWYRSRAGKGSGTRCTLLHRLAKPFYRSPGTIFQCNAWYLINYPYLSRVTSREFARFLRSLSLFLFLLRDKSPPSSIPLSRLRQTLFINYNSEIDECSPL